MTKTVIMLSYYFPPLAGVASERAAAFARHLPAHGWSPRVVAPRAGLYHRGDPVPAELEARVVRTASPEIARALRGGWRATVGEVDRIRVASDPAAGAADRESREVRPLVTGRVGGALRRAIREVLYVPDARWPWIPFAARAARAEVEKARGARVLFSTSVPYSAHLAAWRVAAATGVPWVAEFRDPWSAADFAGVGRSGPRRALDRRMEGAILRRARNVVVTAEATRDLLLAAFPDMAVSRVAVVPNGFEPLEGGGDVPPGPERPLLLVYTGTVNDPAYLVPLLRGVARVDARYPSAARVLAYGPADPWRDACSRAGVEEPGWLELPGVVSPVAARRAAHGASALLLPLPDARYRMTIPGKLWEYLGARRPVVVAHPRGTEIETLLAAHGDGRWVEPYTAERVEAVVAALLAEHRSGSLQAPSVAEERVATLTRAARAGALARLLDRVAPEDGA